MNEVFLLKTPKGQTVCTNYEGAILAAKHESLDTDEEVILEHISNSNNQDPLSEDVVFKKGKRLS